MDRPAGHCRRHRREYRGLFGDDAVLLKPLTYPDPQALVQLVTTSDRGPFPDASIPDYNIWQQQSSIFQQVAAYDLGGAGMNLTGGDHPEQLLGQSMSPPGYFALFGAPVVAGRTFTAAEDSPHGGRVAVLSYGLWKRHFGGTPKSSAPPSKSMASPGWLSASSAAISSPICPPMCGYRFSST